MACPSLIRQAIFSGPHTVQTKLEKRGARGWSDDLTTKLNNSNLVSVHIGGRGTKFPKILSTWFVHAPIIFWFIFQSEIHLIVKPRNSEDVAATVKISVKYNIELSVRSGGHSFQCQGTKVK